MLTPCLTLAEFILALEQTEVLELSRLYDPLNPTIDEPKVNFALSRALSHINSSFVTSNICGKAFIKLNCQQLTIWLARYFLDTTKSRPFVEEDYKKALDLLDFACKCKQGSCPISQAEIEEILGPGAGTVSKFRSGTLHVCRPLKKSTGLLRNSNNDGQVKFGRLSDYTYEPDNNDEY
jgi:hypothetical protein